MKIRLYLFVSLLISMGVCHELCAIKVPDTKKITTILREKTAKKESVLLKEIPGLLTAVQLPAGLANAIGKISITPKKFDTDGQVTDIQADAVIGAAKVSVNIYFDEDGNAHFGFILPKGLDFKKVFPDLGDVANVMNKMTLGKSYFIFSTHNYTDPTLQIDIYPGLNIGAGVELTGILKDADDIRNTLKKAEFLIVDKVEAFCTIFVPTNLANTAIGVLLPFRLGIDFTKKPFNLKKSYIQRIYSANFIERVDLKGRTTIQGGILVDLISQKKPLEFRGILQADPKTGMISVSAQMSGMYKPAFGLKWLGLGPVIGLEYGIMATPPWLNNYAISGGVELGDLVKGAQGLVAFDVSNGTIILDFKLQKLDIDALIKEVVKIVGFVGKVDVSKLIKAFPDIEFNDCQFRIAPLDTWVLGNYYESGIFFKAGIHIGKFEGICNAQLNVIDAELPSVKITAELKPFEVKAGKTSIFKISGKGPGNTAAFLLDLGFLPPTATLAIKGKVEVPPIRFSQESNILFDMGKFVVESKTSLGVDWFAGMLKIAFDPREPQNFLVSMKMDQKFVQHVKGKVAKKIAEFATSFFEVNAASFHTSGRDLMDGKLQEVTFDLDIFRHNIKINVAVDVSNVDDVIEGLVKDILKKISKSKIKEIAEEVKEKGEDILDELKDIFS